MIPDWYPFFVVDYRRDTYHLSLEEDAAYRRLIDEYMVTREALPNDDAALARIVGIPTTEWIRLAVKVRRFFRLRNDKLWHKRCELELRAQNARHNSFRERAQKGGMKKALNAKRLAASSMLDGCLNLPHYKERKKDLTDLEIEVGAVDKPVDKCGQLSQKRSAEEGKDAVAEMRARRMLARKGRP